MLAAWLARTRDYYINLLPDSVNTEETIRKHSKNALHARCVVMRTDLNRRKISKNRLRNNCPLCYPHDHQYRERGSCFISLFIYYTSTHIWMHQAMGGPFLTPLLYILSKRMRHALSSSPCCTYFSDARKTCSIMRYRATIIPKNNRYTTTLWLPFHHLHTPGFLSHPFFDDKHT